MKGVKFVLLGVLLGVIFTKSEVISWFRIYEMFRFKSFHMFGIIGSAVVLGIIIVQLIKKKRFMANNGKPIEVQPKAMS